MFAADMFFACMGAGVTLVIPLIIRYITNDVIYRELSESKDMNLTVTIHIAA